MVSTYWYIGPSYGLNGIYKAMLSPIEAYVKASCFVVPGDEYLHHEIVRVL